MEIEQRIYGLRHFRFWAAFWVHMRPYLLFVSGVAGLAGLTLAEETELTDWKIWLGFVAFFFAYGFGQALTDCFQTDTDRLSAPYRPLSQGIVTTKTVGLVALSGLLVVSLVLMVLNYLNILLCGLSVLGLATYTYIKRNYWWGGPFYNSWIVALLPAMGYLIATQGTIDVLFQPKVVHLILLSFFAYANFVLIGYLKDITADRETGYLTFPVVFGWNATVGIGYIFVALSAYLAWQLTALDPIGIGLTFVATAIALSGLLYAQFTSKKTEENAAYPIVSTVRSFLIWHLAVGVAHHRSLLFFTLGFYIFFEIVLWARPMREQI